MQTPWDADRFRSEVTAVLTEFLDGQADRLAPLGDDAARLVRAARGAVAGGKRFRAAFCYWGYRAVAPEQTDEAALVRACAALELLHASALVHDDLMDASDTRRGHPSVHRVFEAEHRTAGWRGRAEQYGAAAAILLGDLLQAWADELLRTSGLPDPAAGLAVFDLTRSEVISGQFLDVSVQARGRADVETAMTVLRYKSAKYSIERPVQLGAALAGADPDRLADLSGYGLPLGEAFQLRDDLLGVYGDPAVTGKPAGDDLVEGKRTVLIALALDGADPAAADRLDAALGTDLSQAQVAELRDLIDAAGAHEEVERLIESLVTQALTALDAAAVPEPAATQLRHLAAAASAREV